MQNIHLGNQLDPFIAAQLTTAFYLAKDAHERRGDLLLDEQGVAEVLERAMIILRALPSTWAKDHRPKREDATEDTEEDY